MGTLTIRDLDDDVKARLRVRAAHNGRSMEAEAREILAAAVDDPRGGASGTAAPPGPWPSGVRIAKPATRVGGWRDIRPVPHHRSTQEILDELRAERLWDRDEEG
ncbi:MAG: hypothetical protein KDA98_11050 [Acidimicrobiales bacterium]|nr:hypothetical protein [Acidimicrobiales bacterium]